MTLSRPDPKGMPVPPRKALFATLTAGAILVFGLTGCGIISLVTDAAQGKKDVFTIQVGDCMNDEAGEVTEVTSVRDISCDDPHDNEVYLTWQLDGVKFPADMAYPGHDAMLTEADSGCMASFEPWVNAPYDETSLDYLIYFPTEQSWDEGDREVACLAYDLNGPVTGSLKGKGADYPY